MRLLFTFALCFFTAFTTYAQSLEGIITNQTGESIPGITVSIEGTDIGTISNEKGFYRINDLSPGEISLVFRGVGFEKFSLVLTIAENDVIQKNISLKKSVFAIPEIVISGTSLTGGLEGLNEIPGSAHYISPKEIQKFSYTDINRTLRSVPGLNLQEEDGFGLRPNIGIRGTGSERSSKITLMEDGVLIAPAPYSAPAAYYFPTIGTMQAVEILKGSSQIKYGPYTTGGAINLISTQIPSKFTGKLDLSGGSFENRNIHAFVGDSQDRFGYLIESFQYSSDGFKQLENGVNTGYDKKDLRLKFRWNTLEDAKIYQSLNFKLGISDEESNETYLGLTENDFTEDPFQRYAGSQNDKMISDHQQYSITHILKASKHFHISTTAYRTEFQRNWYKLDAVIDSSDTKTKIASLLEDPFAHSEAFDMINGNADPEDGTLLVKANNRSYYAHGVQSVLSFDLQKGKIKHDIDLGIRIHKDEVDRFQWIDEFVMDNATMELTNAGEQGTESNRIQTANAFASYVQYEIETGALSIMPGVRFERIILKRKDFGKTDPHRIGTELSERENEVNAFIPGIGFTYKLDENNSLFGGVHKGFAPPGSSANSKAESSVNYELGTRFNTHGWSGQLVGFYSDYDNLLGSDLAASGGNGSGELYNGGSALTYGLEFQTTYDLLKENKHLNLPVSVVYTYTNAEFRSSFDSSFEGWGEVQNGDHLPYLAEHQFTFLVGLEHENFDLNFSGRFIDEMRTSPGIGSISTEMTDEAFVLDASANFRLNENLGIFCSGTNLSDKVYIVARRPAGLRPGMPRAFTFGLKARF